MKEPRTSTGTAPIIATVMLLTLLGAYVAGYFLLSKRGSAASPAGLVYVHGFRYQWLADLYEPATKDGMPVRYSLILSWDVTP